MFKLVQFWFSIRGDNNGFKPVKLSSKEETLLGNGGLCVLRATNLAAYCCKNARLGSATGL